MKLPKAKVENMVVQDLEKELLIYNLTTHQAFTLNETSKIVFNHCNGVTAFDELTRRYQFTGDLIHFALDELSAKGLLEGYASDHFSGLTRREAIKRVGLGTMIALPVIAGIVAPTAAHAASGAAAARRDNGTTCTTQTNASTECKSGRCTSTVVYTYSTATGSNSSSSGGLKCCLNGNIFTGSYTLNNANSGTCQFSDNCCTRSGTETFDAAHNQYYCTCAATS